MDRIRLHLDENVNPAIAEGLRRRGVDVTTAREQGLLEAPDASHVQFANHESRVIVTHDQDFLAWASSAADHAGIVYTQMDALSVGQVIRGLMTIVDLLEPAEMRNHVEFL